MLCVYLPDHASAVIKLFGYTAGTIFPTVLLEFLYRNDAIYQVASAFSILCFLMSMDFYRAFMWILVFTILILSSGQNMRIKLYLFAILTYGRSFLMSQSGWTYSYVLNTKYVMPLMVLAFLFMLF